jgi:tetratricopeptide (TPR) repeat protein
LSLIISASYAGISWLGRQWDQAIEQTRTTLDLDPSFAAGLWARARSYDGKGMLLEAIAYAQEAVKVSGGTQLFFLADLGHAYATAGNQPEALRALQNLEALQKHRYIDPCLIAQIYVALGDKQAAFRCLEQALQERAAWVPYLAMDPWLDPIRHDPRFGDVLQRAGLVSRGQ